MSTPLNSTGNPPVNLDTMVPLALAIVIKAPFLANETLYQVAGLLLAGPISDTTTVDGFVHLVQAFLPSDNTIPNLKQLASAVFDDIPYLRSYVVEAVKMMPSGQDQRKLMNAVVWISFGIAAVVVIGRIWSRLLLMRRLLLCDWFILLSIAIMAVFSSLCTYGTMLGVATHVWDVKYPKIVLTAKLSYFGELLYRPALLLVKLSLLSFYPSLCRAKVFLISVYTVIFIQLLHFFGGQFAIIFQCDPVDFWHHLSEMHCTNRYLSYTFLSAVNVVLDAAIFALPLYIVAKLRMTLREKVLSGLLFCMGSSVCIVSIVRMQTLPGLTRGLDFTWVEAKAAICAALEVNLAIICASIPSLRALIVYYTMSRSKRAVEGKHYGAAAPQRTASVNSWRRGTSMDDSTNCGVTGANKGNVRESRWTMGSAWRESLGRWRHKPQEQISSLEPAPPPVASYPDPITTGATIITTCEAVPKKESNNSIRSNSQLDDFCVEYEKKVEVIV